jgi:cytochrome c556
VLFVAALCAATYLLSQAMAGGQTVEGKAFKNLHELMEEGIHEEFTFLSFTLWHDAPMTEEKMDAIAKSASQLQRMAESIPSLRPRYLEAERARDDLKAFDAGATELSKTALLLAEAATRRDRAGAEKLFDRMEASCRSCHTKFNKPLADK